MAPRKRRCPSCGEVSGVRIVYGMPDVDLVDQAERGLVVLGGCMVEPDQPTWACLREECRAEW